MWKKPNCKLWFHTTKSFCVASIVDQINLATGLQIHNTITQTLTDFRDPRFYCRDNWDLAQQKGICIIVFCVPNGVLESQNGYLLLTDESGWLNYVVQCRTNNLYEPFREVIQGFIADTSQWPLIKKLRPPAQQIGVCGSAIAQLQQYLVGVVYLASLKS